MRNLAPPSDVAAQGRPRLAHVRTVRLGLATRTASAALRRAGGGAFGGAIVPADFDDFGHSRCYQWTPW